MIEHIHEEKKSIGLPEETMKEVERLIKLSNLKKNINLLIY